METRYQEEGPSLFSLDIDPTGKSHLYEAARWGKFLAIVGFVISVLIFLVGIFFRRFLTAVYTRPGQIDDGIPSDSVTNAMAIAIAIGYTLGAVINFFPCFFLFRFATKMKAALNSNQQQELNVSFQNLKKMFRFVGIITIILLVFYGLGLLFQLLSYASR